MNLNRILSMTVLSLACSAAVAQPLNSQQKLMALQTLQSITLGTATVNSMNPDMKPGHPGQDPLSQKFLSMSAILQSGLCKANVSNTDDHNNTAEKIFTLDGAQCPINYKTDDKSLYQAGTSSSTVSYQVRNPNYKKFTDVDAYIMNFSGSITAAPQNTYKIAVNGQGSAHSQQMGQIPFTVNGGGLVSTDGTGAFTTSFVAQIPNLTVELKIVSQQQANSSTVAVYLNDVQLTAEEITTYLNPPFVPQEKEQNLMHLFGLL